MDISCSEKHVHPDRRSQPPKPDPNAADIGLASCSSSNPAGLSEFIDSRQNPGSNPNFDDRERDSVMEEQLEEKMLKMLELLYKEAIAKLIALGYDEKIVTKAILKNGHCYGSMDALTNVIESTLCYLNSLPKGREGNLEDTKQGFADLSQLIEFSLACLVCLLKRAKPCLRRGDAMWRLIMCDLHVGRAIALEVTATPNPNENGDSTSPASSHMENVNNDTLGVTPASCRFHSGWGFEKKGTNDFPVNHLSYADSEKTVQRDTQFPYWSVLSPSKNSLMQTNVAMFAAAYRAKLRSRKSQSEAGSSSFSSEDSSSPIATEDETHPPPKSNEESLDTLSMKNQIGADMIWKKLRDLNLEGDGEFVPKDKKDEMLLNLLGEVMDLENQVKERKEWAHQKAMQAARKLSHDLTELKMLRMEREENQRLKQEKPTADDLTMKRLSVLESALRKTSGQVNRANLAASRLESENAEIRAEIEASKLSATESVAMCLETSRREKKYLKKLLAWEKQRAKLQEDITAEKQKLIELQEELLQVEAATKTAEAKWKEEQKSKKHAQAQVGEEKRLKEATEANNKRNHETLRSKIELDFQRYKDDLQRLEHELSHIKTSTFPDQQLTKSYGSYPQDETNANMLYELDDSDEKHRIDRVCIRCRKHEVSVLFLPCAHQVLCSSCNEEYGKKGKAKCPACSVRIEQRIRVFGTSS